MAERTTTINAALAGTIELGGDLTVNRFGFGAMRITGEGIWGEPEDREECKRVLRRTIELGINLIDTADSYGPEVSERLIAETLYPYPDELVIATKGGMTRPAPGRWNPDGRPAHLRAACEGSLKRLRDAQPGRPCLAAVAFAGDAAHTGDLEGRAPRGKPWRRDTRPATRRPGRAGQSRSGALSDDSRDLRP